ncbi:MAG: ribonuclease Y [Dethiobacteria bacterium]|jgi:ribonuclease Y|nr:ribonuclease Y [Bacillota bacterium]NMD32648.1 ribonuclease Y [Bacillota bacterium]HPZ42064.1 ribonuclease Y [Bacillota bacterium]HQD52942.1 ribonuclease Y [Bacillota bacterium]
MYYILTAVIALLLGVIAGYFVRKLLAEARISSAETAAQKIVEEAKQEAKAIQREKFLEAKEEAHRLRNEIERESRERRNELQRIERRLSQKEDSLDRKTNFMEKKEEELRRKEEENRRIEDKLTQLHQQQRLELERISNMSMEEARETILQRARDEVSHEMAMMVKEIEDQAKNDAAKKSREIITMAIQRCAADHASEATVSVVSLPNDEMKGRIIGREGRNIRALETLTGIDLIIDDTPEAVILSGFDPIRREIARISLEKLVSDGRIHPARIEEVVEKTRKEVETQIREEGERATFETGVHGLHPELVFTLGKLRYRTSYGQNVLQHSIEVSHLAGNMAGELDLDVALAKRAGLLHDIGKATDHESEGSHVIAGADLVKRYKEPPAVVNAVAAHHGDVDFQTLEAVLIQAADAISASRPGARRETLEAYIRRLEKLEGIADSFDGVEKAYAIHAGREIRIMVKPERIDDFKAIQLARDIVKKIESELEYPGQIKVNVIRETRAVDYAK